MTKKQSLINYKNIPYWNEWYIYSFDTIHDQSKEIVSFYFNVFYKEFIKFNLIDLKGSDNYIFILYHHLKKLYKSNELPELTFVKYCLLIYNNYPVVKGFFEHKDFPYLLAKNSYFNEAHTMIFKSGLNQKFDVLFVIQQQTGKNTMTKEIIKEIISKDSYTKLGLNNAEELLNSVFQKIKQELLNNNLNKKHRLTFWDLFIDIEGDVIKPYPEKYYQRFFKTKSKYYQVNRIDKKTRSDWIYKDGVSEFFDEGVKLHPLGHHLVKVSIINYLNKEFKASENEFRVKNGFSKIGEGNLKWKSENELFMLIKSKFKNEKIERQASPLWLNRQHLDIYFPERNIAIEYQGLQHYEPVDFFGGIEAFEKIIERDKRKKSLCEENDCNIIYVRKGYDIKDVNLEIRKIINAKNKKTNNNYSIKEVAKINKAIEVGASRKIYDCKTKKIISFEKLKKTYPKIKFDSFVNRNSVYKRYILESKLATSNIPDSWKTIKNINTGETFRFNKIEFANHVRVPPNNVWNFFQGKQKLFHYKFEIIEE